MGEPGLRAPQREMLDSLSSLVHKSLAVVQDETDVAACHRFVEDRGSMPGSASHK